MKETNTDDGEEELKPKKEVKKTEEDENDPEKPFQQLTDIFFLTNLLLFFPIN